MYEELLNLPEGTGRLGTMVAIDDLRKEAESMKAARAAKEAELQELRASTAELFGRALEAEGRDEEAVEAAKTMWKRNPHDAALVIAGCSVEEAVSAARGCNQYKHKPDCPEADGAGGATETEPKNQDFTELKKDFEAADQKVRNAISRIYDLQQEKEKIPNKAFSETVDRFNAIKKKQIDLEIKTLQKERDDAIEERDRIAGSIRELLTESRSQTKKALEDVKSAHEPSIEELLVGDLVQAAGCNQYKHKPGCPEADSTEHSNDRSWADKSNYTKLKSTIDTAKKARERYNESPSQENSDFLSTATARVKKYAESLISENKKIFDRLNKEGMSKQDDYELGERRPYSVLIDGQRSYSNFIGAANYLKNNASGERVEEALRDIETSAKELADLDAELTKILDSHNKKTDITRAAHEPSLEDMLVGDLVQAAGCNQYKHKPGCPEADGGSDDNVYYSDVVYYGEGEKAKSWKDASYASFQKVCSGKDLDIVSRQVKKDAFNFAKKHKEDVVTDIFVPSTSSLGNNKYRVDVRVWKNTPYNAQGTYNDAILHQIREERYDLEDQLIKTGEMLKSLKDSGEDELEESIKEKQKKISARIKELEKISR